MIAILSKELRGRMRGWAAPVLLTGYVGLLALIVSAIFGLEIENRSYFSPEMAAMGVEVFGILSVLQTGLIMLIAPALTAGAIAGEKDRQTFDLLLSTRLTAFEILSGKLLAGIAFTLLLIVASVPVLSLIFLVGGAPMTIVLQSVAVQAMTAVLMGAGGLFFSTIVRRPGAATALGILLALLLGLGTVVIGLLAPPVGASHKTFSAARPGEMYVERGPLGTSIKMKKMPNGEALPVLPLAFHLNPGIAIVSAASTPDAPGYGPVTGMGRELSRVANTTPMWLGYLIGGSLTAAAFFAAAWWRLEARPIGRLRRAVGSVFRRRKTGTAAG